MSSAEVSRIVKAMKDLAEARDAGECVSEIINDVADEYDVSSDELRKRAEQSWGSPLETDRARNAAHFAIIENRRALIDAARQRAHDSWMDMIPRGGKPIWFFSFKNWLAKQDVEDANLQQQMRGAYMSEISRLDRNRAAGLIPDINDD